MNRFHRSIDKIKPVYYMVGDFLIGAETEQGKAAIGLAKVEESRPEGQPSSDGGRATR
ncbi:MAG: hypothetical protein Ct9H300mP27_03310 [Chloroflexota bacterium]|nr:MAG: hypothetical protein Ct9H300mP27_03310 [Chloroflexota bacterium]